MHASGGSVVRRAVGQRTVEFLWPLRKEDDDLVVNLENTASRHIFGTHSIAHFAIKHSPISVQYSCLLTYLQIKIKLIPVCTL